jgi:hypothetical protein
MANDDWRTLPMGDALDTIIGQRLGWTNIELAAGGLRGLPPAYDMETWLGRWSRSIDDAWCLPSPKGSLGLGTSGHLAVWWQHDGYRASYAGTLVFGEFTGVADTVALAICRAWLAYNEPQL